MATPKRRYIRFARTGGGTALDGIDGDSLNGQDIAWTVDTTANEFFMYRLDTATTAAEADPEIIAPDDNPGDKRWILIQAGST